MNLLAVLEFAALFLLMSTFPCADSNYKGAVCVHVIDAEPQKLQFNIPFSPSKLKDFSQIPVECNDVKIELPINQSRPPIIGKIFDANDNYKKLNMVSEYQFHGSHYYFCRLRNVYYRSCYSYIYNNISYYFDRHSKKWEGKVEKSVETLVVLTSPSSHKFFGDALIGGIIKLAYIPKNVLNGATITSPSPKFEKYYREALELYEVRNYNLIYVNEKNYIFANELYTIFNTWDNKTEYSEAHLSYLGEFIQNGFIKKVEEKYNTTNIQPTIYGVMQREKGMMRYVANFDDLFSMMKREHPLIDFKIIPHGFNNFRDASATMRSLKWLFGPTGSNINYVIFMHSRPIVCFYLAEAVDHPIINILLSREAKYVGFMLKGVRHYSRDPINMNLTKASHYINYSLNFF